jgi:hypothetical protein
MWRNDSLVLGVSAIRATCELGAQCSGEAKVSVERNGPNGSIAGDRPDASDGKLAVAFAFQGTCSAAGNFYLTGGEGPGSRRLPAGLKSVGSKERTSDASHKQKRANSARRRRVGLKSILMALTLVLGVSAIRATCELGAQCSGEAKVSIERNGPNGSIAGDR